jgi:hypothetical protein
MTALTITPRRAAVSVAGRVARAITVNGVSLRSAQQTATLYTGSPAATIASDAEEWDVLASVDFAGMWFANEATDNGTTLTIPNVVSGGPAMTSTGAGRPTIGATALNGQPGIVNTGATAKLSAAIDLTGETGCTIWLLLYEPNNTPGASIPFRYGVGAADSLYSYSNIFGTQSQDFSRSTAIGTPIARTSGINSGLVYPRVLCYRTDSALASGEMLPVQTDGVDGITTYAGPTNTTGTLAGGPFDWMSDNGSSFFPGIGGAAAIARGSVSSAKSAAVSSYLLSRAGLSRGLGVMCGGDSWVSADASEGPAPAPWRRHVQSLATAEGAAGLFYEAVGGMNGGQFPNDRYLAGGGNTIAQFRQRFVDYGVGINRKLLLPGLLIIHCGINDLIQGATGAQAVERYTAMADDAREILPDCRLAFLKQARTSGAWAGLVPAINILNAGMVEIVSTRPNTEIWPDFYDGVEAGTLTLYDGLHLAFGDAATAGAMIWARIKVVRAS